MKRRASSPRKAVVLLSGGLDSAVALAWAQRQGFGCHTLWFDYGQRHRRELRSARAVAHRARVPMEIVRFRLPWSGSSLTGKRHALPAQAVRAIGRRIPSTYVPGRNTIFLSFALSYADEIGAEALVIGANAVDYSGYPDCRRPYLSAFERTAQLGSRLGTEGRRRLRVLSPLVRLTKAQIVSLGRSLGVPLELTWSCYRGGARPCGVCDSCRLREKGFKEANQTT